MAIKIKMVEKYIFNGVEYKDLASIATIMENKIGAVIDRADVTLTPRQKLNLLKSIVESRRQLVNALTVTIGVSDGSLYAPEVNILDVKK